MKAVFEANRFPLTPGLRLLEASAGTGKTFSLAHLVLRLVSEAELPLNQLLVVTFTNAAAAELRERIGRRLQQALTGLEAGAAAGEGNGAGHRADVDPALADWLTWARPRAEALRAPLLLALEDLDGADITTIHGFCLRSLQRHALESGHPPELQLDTDAAPLLRQVCHDYWRQQVLALPAHLLAGVQSQLKGPDTLVQLLARLDGDPALALDPLPEGMDAHQPLTDQLVGLWRSSWTHFCALWARHGQALEASLCSTAADWRSRGISKTGTYSPRPRKDRCAIVSVWIAAQPDGGDHAACLAQKELNDYFHPGAFLKQARPIEATAPSAPGGREPSLPERPLMEAVAALLEGPAEALLLHACHWGRRELARRRQRSGRMGYGQLLESLDPGEDPHAPSPLLEAVAQRYAAALIDEFQDTDPIQWRILSRAFSPERHRLVLVGDPKQAIYRFRGGELATYRLAAAAAETSGGVSALTTNYRATATLIKALNGLMAPGLRRSGLEVPQVEPRPGQAAPGAQGPPTSLELLWLGSGEGAGEAPQTSTELEKRLPGQVARVVVELIAGGEVPQDICLLVNTHRQAEQLRAALERCRIASRLVMDGDVFTSPAATALQRLLDALAHPGHPRRLRLLAASPLLGWSAAELAAASPERWSALAAELAEGAEQLQRRGLMGVLAALLDAPGLARLAPGGRVLADLQQCAVLVQEQLHSHRLGPAAAADWLRQRRLEPDPDPPETHQPHSDLEDGAVWVVTIHRSKGLEYPVVLCPYLWKAPSRRLTGPGLRWQPPHHPAPVLDLHLNAHWGQGCQARLQHSEADLQEAERRAYVACTRARRRLLLAWGPVKEQQGNPLHSWLFGQEPPPGLDDAPYTDPSDQEWRQRLDQEIARRNLPMRLRDLPDPGTPVQVAPAAAVGPELAVGPVPSHRLDRSWGRSSYTSWTRGSHAAAPQTLEEGRETDGLALELELPEPLGASEAGEPSGKPEATWPAESPLAHFPRGSQAGDCLHRILEQLDYQQPAAEQAELVGRELQRSGIAASHLENALSGLDQLRLSPLGGPLGAFQLDQLPAAERLNEMGFDLPLGLVRAEALARPFRDHPGGACGADYADRLALLEVHDRGFLTGSIDLVFRQGERWWVLDWKSNWLGERDADGQPLACGPRHYGPGALAALMAANHYPLQAHLYLVALHRYLRWRLPGYDPACHLGGYAYVFLRGVPGPSERARQQAAQAELLPGMAVECPPLARLLALDRVLEGAA